MGGAGSTWPCGPLAMPAVCVPQLSYEPGFLMSVMVSSWGKDMRVYMVVANKLLMAHRRCQ